MINFNFGKKKADKKQLIILSITLSILIAALSQCTGIHENKFWDLLDEVQRKYFPQTALNEIIRQDSDKIDRRVKRDLDKAISEYQKLTGYSENVKIPAPLYSEENGVLRLCSPWVEGCTGTPLEIIKEEKIKIDLQKEDKNKINFFKF